MPRKSRKKGNQDKQIGIHKELVCVVGAIDENDNIILKIVGNGPASKDMIDKALKDKIKKGSTLVTDSKNSYVKFAFENDLLLKQIPTKKHTVEGMYNLGNINSLFSDLDNWISNFNGISTRHLQQYLDWFVYRKILKYTLEYINHKHRYHKESIIQSSSLRKKDVCKMPHPVDVDAIFKS
ncbi:MAG: IS1595 family transposase [Bacilli bacterium]|nr:IS1595 family transposase [Bacilli bacterium]